MNNLISLADLKIKIDDVFDKIKADIYKYNLSDYLRTYLLNTLGEEHKNIFLKEIATHLPSKHMKVLDIGFGISSIVLRFLCNYDVYVLDAHEGFTDMARDYGIKMSITNLEKGCLPFRDNSFDIIFCVAVLEHLNFNPHLLINEFRRVVKNNSYLIVVTPQHGKI